MLKSGAGMKSWKRERVNKSPFSWMAVGATNRVVEEQSNCGGKRSLGKPAITQRARRTQAFLVLCIGSTTHREGPATETQ